MKIKILTAAALGLALLSGAVAVSADESPVIPTLMISQDVYELGTPMRGELSLTNRSADWVEVKEAAELVKHLSLRSDSKKRIKPDNTDKFGAAKTTSIGPGGFVGLTFDPQLVFPKLAEPGRYTMTFSPPGAAEQSVDFHVLPAFDTKRDYGMKLETPMGDVIVDLFEKQAPTAVHNVVQLARVGFYDGAPIPRIQKDFALRVRGPVEEKHRIVPFENTPQPLLAGTVIVEPSPDGRRSSNFPNLHILLTPQPTQQGSVTVVGQIVKGMDVLEKLGRLPTSGPDGRPAWAPIQSLQIQKASVSERDAAGS